MRTSIYEGPIHVINGKFEVMLGLPYEAPAQLNHVLNITLGTLGHMSIIFVEWGLPRKGEPLLDYNDIYLSRHGDIFNPYY